MNGFLDGARNTDKMTTGGGIMDGVPLAESRILHPEEHGFNQPCVVIVL
jgi:hypothetical protein